MGIPPRPIACLATLLIAALACTGSALAASRVHPLASAATAGQERAEVARIEDYWTPARMRSARPLDLAIDASGTLKPQTRVPAGATASFTPVETPEVPPFSVNGRVFVRQGRLQGFCSGTAINTPTRRLVLTAGHCVNSGPTGRGRSVWSNYLEFVPAYNGVVAPFGTFVARRSEIYAPKPWIRHGNPDFDMGAFLAQPNPEGINVADAVGGGATIAIDLPRQQRFQTFGYPGEATHMQTCSSFYAGEDRLSSFFLGPPTMSVRCHWAPGASGGGWLIGDGTQINGLTSYLHLNNRSRTFGPYFGSETIGRLVSGL